MNSKELLEKHDDSFVTVKIKGGEIIIYKGEIYTPEYIAEYYKMK